MCIGAEKCCERLEQSLDLVNRRVLATDFDELVVDHGSIDGLDVENVDEEMLEVGVVGVDGYLAVNTRNAGPNTA
jgi:hypothetical protein